MPIQAITESAFNKLKPARNPTTALFAAETAWYATDDLSILGVVLRDKIDNDWSWVILGKDERGEFRAIEVNTSLESEHFANEDLLSKMNEVYALGEKTFPQG